MNDFKDLLNFFSIFVALNLAYAGIKHFRAFLELEILRIKFSISQLSQLLVAPKMLNGLSQHTRERFIRIENIKEKITSHYNSVVISRRENLRFEEYYIQMFLSSAIFCIVETLLVGLNNKIGSEIILALTSYSFLILFLIIYIFISGFTNPKTDKPLLKPLDVFIVIACIASIYAIGYLYYWISNIFEYKPFYFSEDFCIFFSVLICVLPYTLLFVKSYLHKRKNKKVFNDFVKYEVKLIKIRNDIKKIIKEEYFNKYNRDL